MSKTRYATITMDMLHAQYACVQGKRGAERHLPAVLSTNPEENLNLAERLLDANADCSYTVGEQDHMDLSWFFYTITGRDETDVRDDGGPIWYHDVWLTAQHLAIMADHLTATEAGREFR